MQALKQHQKIRWTSSAGLRRAPLIPGRDRGRGRRGLDLVPDIEGATLWPSDGVYAKEQLHFKTILDI